MKPLHPIILICLFSIHGFSMDDATFPKYSCAALEARGDCHNALQIKTLSQIEFACSPEGHGRKLEISGNSSKSKFLFKREHNTIWMKFEASASATLTFKITPANPAYDFDFLLYKDDGDDFCRNVSKKEILPIRSNLSRNKIEDGGVTGLATLSEESFSQAGPGDNISQGLEVKKGEQFYLVVDNVHGGAEGFTIGFKYYAIKELKGKISDEETGAGVQAQVTWEDADTGELLKKTESDSVTGRFKMNVPVEIKNKNAKYVLTAFAKKHFFNEKTLKAEDLETDMSKTIVVSLPKLKKGAKVKLYNINFYGDSPKTLPSAKPTLERLNLIMSYHPSLNIRIEGHTNGCSGGVAHTQELSEARANTVKKYLIGNEVSRDRLYTKGFNCTKMLFPNPTNPWEMSMNRRVEIVVVSFKKNK